MEWALGVLMCRRKEEQAETFAASKCHQVASLCLLRGCKKVGHFDRGKKGGRASNSDDFNGVGNGAVRSKTFGTSVDNFHNSSEGSESFKLWDELISMSLDMLVYFHRHDSMEIWNDVTCVIVVTPREFGEVGSQKVLFVEYGKIEIVEGGRIIWSRQAKSVL